MCFIVSSDLKPENVLLNEHMHILITDFGSAKMVHQSDVNMGSDEDPCAVRPRKNSFVGTADYVSPELLGNKETSKR